MLGLLSSLLGLGAGFGVALGLRQLLASLGADDAPASFGLTPATVLIGVATAGRRRRRRHPARAQGDQGRALAAMRSQVAARRGPAGSPGPPPSCCCLAGAGALWLAVAAGSMVARSPAARSPPGAWCSAARTWSAQGRLLGTVSGLTRRVPGRLAVANATRNPRRTAATTTALMIGVTLLSAFATGAASLKASVTAAIARQFPVEFALTNSFGETVRARWSSACASAGTSTWWPSSGPRRPRLAGGPPPSASTAATSTPSAAAPSCSRSPPAASATCATAPWR